MDWNLGRYERIAVGLLPAVEVVLERADPTPGARLIDVGCRTGNAALAAAERGARVIGIDPAEHQVAFTDGSPAAFVEAELRDHPLWVEGQLQLRSPERWAELHARATTLLVAANEDPNGFRVTSRYVVASAWRP